jgi:hypothetical protein
LYPPNIPLYLTSRINCTGVSAEISSWLVLPGDWRATASALEVFPACCRAFTVVFTEMDLIDLNRSDSKYTPINHHYNTGERIADNSR